MTTCLGKSCSFGLPRVLFVNCCHFLYLVISLLVLVGSDVVLILCSSVVYTTRRFMFGLALLFVYVFLLSF